MRLSRRYLSRLPMSEFIYVHAARVKGEDDTPYIVRVYAQERTDGTWAGWVEFHPTDERKLYCALDKRHHSLTAVKADTRW
jgi:hypothetical protein